MRRNRLIKRIISIILILLMVALLCALAVLLFRLFSKQQEDMLSSEEYAWQDDWQPFEASYHDYLEKGLPQAWERKLVLNDVINLEFDPLSRDLGLIEYSAKYSTLLEQLEASEPTDTVRYNIRFLRELFAFQKECKRPLEVNQEIQIDLDLDGETETILIERTETEETIFGTQEYHYTVWVNGTTIKMCDKLSVIPLEQSFSTTEAKFSFLHLGGKQAILCELTGYMESWPDSADPAKDYLYIYKKGTAGCFELLDGYYSMVTPEGHLIVNGLRPKREPIIRWPVPQYSWSEYSISDNGIQQVLREGWLACYFDEITIKKELLLTLQDGSEKELPSNTRLINIAYSEEGNLCVVSDTDDYGRLKVKYSENGFPLLLPTEEEMDLFFNIETEQDLAHNWFY